MAALCPRRTFSVPPPLPPMLRRLALAAALVAGLAAQPAAAQTDASVIPASAPAWLSMADAVARSKAESKPIVVHTYAAWCGWCARFDQEVYTDAAVQATIAEHFVATRLDLEGQTAVPFFDHTVTMQQLGTAFGVTGTPTTVFVGPDGMPITKLPGYTDVPTFLLVLRYVHEGAYEAETFQQFKDRATGVAPALRFDVPDITRG